MEPKKTNNQDKFEIEGTIHGKPVSKYIEEQIEYNKSRQRVTIAVLAIIAILAFLWGAISQYKIISQVKQIEKTELIKANLKAVQNDQSNSVSIIDSLQNKIYRLQNDNDILAENAPKYGGVFFEIQIGSFADFNLNQYLGNLANLRQEKHNGKTQYLLGRFRSFKKALLFESDLKRMGLRNSFIIGRIDGIQVSYQEALEAIGESNN
mgnify:CR=1 FL=1